MLRIKGELYIAGRLQINKQTGEEFTVTIVGMDGSNRGFNAGDSPYTPFGAITPVGTIKTCSVSPDEVSGLPSEFYIELYGTFDQDHISNINVENVGIFSGLSATDYGQSAFSAVHTYWVFDASSPGWNAVVPYWGLQADPTDTKTLFLTTA